MATVTLLTAAVFTLMLLAVPIGFAIITGCILVLLWLGGINLMVVPQSVFGGIDSFSLLAIPFFMLAGSLMTAGGMTERLLDFANAVLGRFRGGLAMSGVLASTLFAGISGSAVADTSALGRVLIPAMKKSGYSPAFAAGSIAAANVVAPIIPPSIPFIVLGVLTNQSITTLFLAAVLPGLVYSAAMLFLTWWISRANDYPVHGRSSLQEVRQAFGRAFFALMLPVFILFGIRTGIFNITECSAVAVVYALLVGTFVHRKITPRVFLDCLVSSARTTAVIMIIVGAARLFSWLLAYVHIPQNVANFILATIEEPLVFLLAVNILLLVVGMFMEANAALVMLAPVLFPIAVQLGIDPIHFSVVFVLNLCIGLITPPVGLCLNITSLMANISLERAAIGVLPFLGSALAVLAAITLFPEFTLWLPNFIGGAG